MADTSNLTSFLEDIADAIRTKKGTEEQIPAANFDTEIKNLPTGSNTSDATATQYDVISPKTFYNKDGKITGSIIPTYNSSSSSYGENVVSISDNCQNILGFKIRKNVIIYYTDEELVVFNINSQNSSRYSYTDLGITNITEVDISMNDTKVSIMDDSSSFIYKVINTDIDTSIDISSKKTLSYVRCNFIDIVDTDAIISNGTYSSTVTPTYRIMFNNDDLTYTTKDSYSGNWYRAGRASYQGCATTIYNGWYASGWSVMGMDSSTTTAREVTFQDLGSDLHCSPNNVYAIARNGSKYTVKNMDTNTSVKTFSIPTDFVRFATDTILFIISNGNITLYDFMNNKYIQTVNIPGTIKNVSAANNGNILYILSTDGLFTMGTNYIVSLTRLGNTYIITNDGNVEASDIPENKIAYSNGSKIIGSLPEVTNEVNYTSGNILLDDDQQIISVQASPYQGVQDTIYGGMGYIVRDGYIPVVSDTYSDLANNIGLTADKIKVGETILGIDGIYTSDGSDIPEEYVTEFEFEYNGTSYLLPTPTVRYSPADDLVLVGYNNKSNFRAICFVAVVGGKQYEGSIYRLVKYKSRGSYKIRAYNMNLDAYVDLNYYMFQWNGSGWNNWGELITGYTDAWTDNFDIRITNFDMYNMDGVIISYKTMLNASQLSISNQDIVEDKIGYINGHQIRGSMLSIGVISNSNVDIVEYSNLDGISTFEDVTSNTNRNYVDPNSTIRMSISDNHLADVIGLTADKIAEGNNILGVEGTAETGGIDTSDANATANDITQNKTAYVNGEKITGTLPLFPNSRTFTVDGGITNDTENSKLTISTINTLKQILDSNLNMEFSTSYSDAAEAIGLTTDKIKAGETILGITGTSSPYDTVVTYTTLDGAIRNISPNIFKEYTFDEFPNLAFYCEYLYVKDNLSTIGISVRNVGSEAFSETPVTVTLYDINGDEITSIGGYLDTVQPSSSTAGIGGTSTSDFASSAFSYKITI